MREGARVRRRLSELGRAYPRQYWLMVAGMVLSNAGGSLVWPFLLIFASARLELPLAAVGSLITIQSVAGMLSSFVAGTLAFCTVGTWMFIAPRTFDSSGLRDAARPLTVRAGS